MSIDAYHTFHSPINSSSSKHLYSFSRSARFSPTKISECKSSFYEIKKGAIDKRATSFGLGNKMEFASTQKVPEPGKYQRDSQFIMNKTKRRGFSFGKDQNRSIIQNPQQVKRIPGPGAYISIDQKYKSSYLGFSTGASFSMRGKYEDPLARHGNELGPGHYPDHGSISQRGFYYNTKFPTAQYCKIGKQDRFEKISQKAPGPGYYNGEQKNNLNGTGIYFHSKYENKKANSFAITERPSPAKKNEAPDPGAYSSFSDFALKAKDWRINTRVK